MKTKKPNGQQAKPAADKTKAKAAKPAKLAHRPKA